MIPGVPPKAVNVLMIARFTPPPSYLIEGDQAEFEAVHTMFQIRYSEGWIMVDVSGDKELLGDSGFSDEAFQQSVDALLGAQLIISTHEHHDHIWRLINSPHAERFSEKTILTKEQIHTLVTASSHPDVRLTEEQAEQYLTVDYERFFPIAPGVVLIKAPGHTPGGQMVYVRLKSGRELILTGDVAWQKVGIDRGLQKPEGISAELNENREAIAPQLKWLQMVENMGVTIVVFHDLAVIEEQIEQGIIGDGIEF
jgi:glyoxylase-like metal-dependent hydrolase (beta-lactamase superfamily II)